MYESNLGVSPISGWVFGKGGLFYKLPKMKGRGYIEKQDDEYIYHSDPNSQVDLYGLPDKIGWNDIPDDKIKGLYKDINLQGNIDDADYDLLIKDKEERKRRRNIHKQERKEEERKEQEEKLKIAGELGIDINQNVPYNSIDEIDYEIENFDIFTNSEELKKLLKLINYKKILLLREYRLEELEKTEEDFKEALGIYDASIIDENDPELQELNYIQNRIIEISQAKNIPYGDAFEFFLEEQSKTINDFFGFDNKTNIFKPNNKNPKIPKKLKDWALYDFGSPNMDIEAKNYNVSGLNVVSSNNLNKDFIEAKAAYDEAKKNYDNADPEDKDIYKELLKPLLSNMQKFGIEIQETKFGGGGGDFKPKFKKMADGKIRLHNVYMNIFTKINNTDDRDLIIMVNTANGIFYYNLLEDEDIPYREIDKQNNLYEIDLDKLKEKWEYKKKWVRQRDNTEKEQLFFTIPINKWKRFNIPKNNRI
jgi:hypothetical protein